MKKTEQMLAVVTMILTGCQRLGMPYQKINLDDPEAVKLYAMTLEANGVTPKMLANAAPRINALSQFPVPNDIIGLLEDEIHGDDMIPLVIHRLPGGAIELRLPEKALPGYKEARP